MNITQESFELKKYLKQQEEKNKQERGDVASNEEEPQNTIAEGRRANDFEKYLIQSSFSR